MLFSLLIWTIGTFTMWLRAHLTLRHRGRTDIAGEYKAILELASAITETCEEVNLDPEKLTEQQLREQVKDKAKGGRIAYNSPLLEGKFPFMKNMRALPRRIWVWVKKEKWWVGADFLALLWFALADLLDFTFFLFAMFAFLSISFAMAIGSTNGSRLMFAVGGFVVLGLGIAVPAGHKLDRRG